MSQNTENHKKTRHKSVHPILLRNYSMFLYAILFGILAELVFPYKIFKGESFQYYGFIMIITGSVISYWAQKTTAGDRKGKKILNNDNYFSRGPYKYTRHPTYFGLFIMTLGLSITINSLPSIIFTILVILIIKHKLKKHEENFLEIKYGEVYLKYKNKIKDWL